MGEEELLLESTAVWRRRLRLAKTFLIGDRACERDFALVVFVKMRERNEARVAGYPNSGLSNQHTTVLSVYSRAQVSPRREYCLRNRKTAAYSLLGTSRGHLRVV